MLSSGLVLSDSACSLAPTSFAALILFCSRCSLCEVPPYLVAYHCLAQVRTCRVAATRPRPRSREPFAIGGRETIEREVGLRRKKEKGASGSYRESYTRRFVDWRPQRAGDLRRTLVLRQLLPLSYRQPTRYSPHQASPRRQNPLHHHLSFLQIQQPMSTFNHSTILHPNFNRSQLLFRRIIRSNDKDSR